MIRSARILLDRYNKLYPGDAKFTAGGACTGLYRGIKLWEAAVKEAGSLKQDDVIKALDHAKIAEGPGGPAEMVPGQHHVRMNMYIAQANNGHFRIVKAWASSIQRKRLSHVLWICQHARCGLTVAEKAALLVSAARCIASNA